MKSIYKKKNDLSSNIRITEIQLKTHHSANHFFPDKKQSQGCLTKKNGVCLIPETLGNNIKYRQKSTKDYSSTPKNKEEILQSKQSFNSLNNNQSTPSSTSNSVKNASKRVIDYSTNSYIQKNHQNYLSLYTIQEHMKKITTNSKSNSNITTTNSNSSSKRNNELGLTQKALSSSSKLFQIQRLGYPLQCTSTANNYDNTHGNSNKNQQLDHNNIRHYNNHHQQSHQKIKQYHQNNNQSNQIDSPHSKLRYGSSYWITTNNITNPNTNLPTQSNYNSNNTNANIHTNANIINKNIRKRNELNIPSPKRFLSLTKDRNCSNKNNKTSKTNIHIKPVNSNPHTNLYTNHTSTYGNYKATKYPIYNNIKSSNLRSFQTNDRKYGNVKSNSLNKNRQNHISNSNSMKKDPSLLTSSTTSNNNIRDSRSKDAIIQSPRATGGHNSFIVKSPTVNSNNNSIDNNHLQSRDIITIKVNRMGVITSSSSTITAKAAVTTKRFLMNDAFIKAYSGFLTQREVEELKGFPYPIYYRHPFEERKRNQVKYSNEINSSFSYVHFPNFNYAVLPRSFSYKKYTDITTQVDADEFNDDEGNYIITPGDHISYRYEIVELLGTGSFGEAVRCVDHKTKEIVCVKIIKANPKLYIQATVEIKVLQYIKKHDITNESNIVKFHSHFWFRNHICIVFELLDINLYDHLKLNDYVGFDINQIKSFTTQVLFTLLFLKKHKILHCDLKPENILLLKNDTMNVKVIDFGSSCFDTRKIYTYIQSRFYRAPEIIMDKGYDSEIDIWSLGCILPELYSGLPIFPGDDEREQMIYIMEYLDVPTEDYINNSNKKLYFFNEDHQPYIYHDSDGTIRAPGTKTLDSFIPGSPSLFQDFIMKCLKWIPKERIGPDEALLHDWIIGDMSPEELSLHFQKIKRIKMEHTIIQYHQQQQKIAKKHIQKHHVDLTTLSSTDRQIRGMSYNRSSSKSNITQTSTTSKINPNLKSPVKQTQKRTQSKDITHSSYILSTKCSLNHNRKVSLVIETISNIKRRHESSSKKKHTKEHNHYNTNNHNLEST